MAKLRNLFSAFPFWAPIVWAFWSVITVGVASAQTDEQKKTIVAHWDGQRSSVVTAQIKYVLFSTGSELVPMSPEKLRELVESADLGKGLDAVAPVMAALSTRRSEGPWCFTQTFIDGENVREDFGLPGGLTQSVVVRGGTFAEYGPANNMVMLEAAGASPRHVRRLRDFRFVLASKALTLPIKDRAKGRWLLADDSSEVVIDPATGDAHRYTLLQDGAPTRDYLQEHFVAYPGGVVFPSMYVSVDYSDGVLRDISLSFIVKATFNEDLAADTFSIQVPAKTNLIDKRSGDKILSMHFDKPSSDAVASANVKLSPPEQARSSLPYVTVALVVLAGVMILVVFRYAGRRRRTE